MATANAAHGGVDMNVVLLVVDSLRACSLREGATDRPRTPFMDALARDTVCFRRAYATECWTLPTHLSMFTGLLPSEHGAHFQTMAYGGGTPTVAETCARAGYHTEVMSGIGDHLLEENYFYFIAHHRHRSDLIEQYPHMLVSRGAEGIIAIDTHLDHKLAVPAVAVALICEM